MRVREFLPEDYPVICGWLEKRGVPAPTIDHLPPVGWIVDDVCCGFLVQSDSGIAFVDFFVSNPDSSEEDRLAAYDMAWPITEKKARDLGFKMLGVYTKIPKVVAISMRHGMKYDQGPFFYLVKKLEADNVRG